MITQENIYSFTRCSYYTNYFKDKFPYSEKYKIFDKVIKKIFVTHLKNQSYAPVEGVAYRMMIDLYKELKLNTDLLPQQIKKSINTYTILLSKILNLLKIESKIPVFGPTYHFYSHNGINLKLYNTALYRSLDGSYYAFYLSPYSTPFQVKNDPLPYILWSLMDNFIKETLSETTLFTIRAIYIKNNNEVDFEEIFSYEEKAFSNINSILENIDLQLPQYNCKEKCKYKNRCNI